MKQNIFIFGTTLITACILSACSPAASSEPNEPRQNITPETQTISQSHAAIFEIIEAGNKAKQEKDADGLSDAAHLLTLLGAQPFNADMPDLAQDWRDTAITLRNTGQDSKKNFTVRGRVKGPAYREKILAPGSEEVLQEIYYASERAELTLKVLSSGNTVSDGALTLRVAEQTGNTPENVCTLNAKQAAASCQWLPLWTAKYNITIVNHGDSPVSYLLVTN